MNRFFRGLTAAQQQALAVRHPLVVGNPDGVPVALRYRANARSLQANHDPRYAHLAPAHSGTRDGNGDGDGPDPTGRNFGARRVPAHEAHGHTGYFAPGTDSLRAFVSITKGEAR
ncbi:hypothetical protein [Streptomyces sp. NPDC058103]|uniref:hypothetical protein n=1 Tax=Streptomyces sp. NPDC058103 TaxID=3346341 RepID=UPI0036EA5C9A